MSTGTTSAANDTPTPTPAEELAAAVERLAATSGQLITAANHLKDVRSQVAEFDTKRDNAENEADRSAAAFEEAYAEYKRLIS